MDNLLSLGITTVLSKPDSSIKLKRMFKHYTFRFYITLYVFFTDIIIICKAWEEALDTITREKIWIKNVWV